MCVCDTCSDDVETIYCETFPPKGTFAILAIVKFFLLKVFEFSLYILPRKSFFFLVYGNIFMYTTHHTRTSPLVFPRGTCTRSHCQSLWVYLRSHTSRGC